MTSKILAGAVALMAVGMWAGCTANAEKHAQQEEKAEGSQWESSPGTYAVFQTSMGNIVCELFGDVAPVTVENFVGLAQGTKEWTDPRTAQKRKTRFYDGLIFHRVIEEFMIQGGDPLGNGTGGPGYRFQDECSPDVTFDAPGKLAMANAGPNTNGSQFFITLVPTHWLNGRHTIFGQVVEGQDVAEAISMVPKGPNDRPLTPVTIEKLEIVTVHAEPDEKTGA